MKRISYTFFGILVAGVLVVAAQDAATNLRPVVANESVMVARGESALVNGEVTVSLPSWFEGESAAGVRTVQLTCKDGWSPLSASAPVGGKFTVKAANTDHPAQAFWWTVSATTKTD